jgi:hypothetical protein
MTGPEIIEAFGGRQAIATLTGAEPDAVTQWRRNGIPAKYWHVLVAHAHTAGVPGITFEALRASRPVKVAA